MGGTIAGASIYFIRLNTRWLRRAEFIRGYQWPRGLYTNVLKKYPTLTRKELALVSRGLRQFFLAYLKGRCRFVSMPSKIADEMWHEFILYTREYESFCRRAFGNFLHHTPAVVLGPDRQGNEGLRRVWAWSCRDENIDLRNPTRLPILFALDAKLNIPDGFRYQPDCEDVKRRSPAGCGSGGPVHCAGDLSRPGVDGTIAGLDADNGGVSAVDGGTVTGDSGSGSGCGGGGK